MFLYFILQIYTKEIYQKIQILNKNFLLYSLQLTYFIFIHIDYITVFFFFFYIMIFVIINNFSL